MTPMTSGAATYKNAGVDIDTANEFIRKIKPLVKKTEREEVLSSLGHYAGLFALKKEKYHEPVLVASTDGVGTKLKLALDCKDRKKFRWLGQDLVAMSANDILCMGAEPLFFLDYFATGKLEVKSASALLGGIAHACEQIRCSLLGGETAEMPKLYRGRDFDLAGFIVGVVEKKEIIDGSQIAPGDKIIGIASSGFHANGYSLIRKIIADKKLSLDKRYPPLSRPLGDLLMEPTRLYVNTVMKLKGLFRLHGIAHITGGGLLENLPRLFSENRRAVLQRDNWPNPPLFELFKKWGKIPEKEMHRVFNCGIGLMLVVSAEDAEPVLKRLHGMKEEAWIIGEITERTKGAPPIEIQ